jgi:hypothetical protein
VISVNMPKARTIAHTMRRAARDTEFAPHDAVIARRIPGSDDVAAEAARQAIREKYALIQDAIEVATNVDALKTVVDQFGAP